MIISKNLAALNASRMLNKNVEKGSKSTEKLSSGKRINRASDDAAGLAISQKMRAQIRGLDQASFNTQTGVELTQTADGALGEINDMLGRIKELTVQAGNDTNVEDDKKAIQMEIDQLSKQVDRVAKNTEFNTIKLIDGSLRAAEPTGAVLNGKGILDDKKINIHDDMPAEIVGNVINPGEKIQIHNGKPAVTAFGVCMPTIIKERPNDVLNITYEDKGIVLSKNLKLGDYIGAPLPVDLSPDQLKNCIDHAINDSELKDKITVRLQGTFDLVFESVKKSSDVVIKLNDSPVLEAMVTAGDIPKLEFKHGETKNNTLNLKFNHKTNASTTNFDEEGGYSISEAKWVANNVDIDIPFGEYDVDQIINVIKNSIQTKGIDNEVKVENFGGRIKFSSVDEGEKALLELSDPNKSALLSNLKISFPFGNGKDKTDTFAIEIDVKYNECEFNTDLLSDEELKKLYSNGVLYTDDGYIIEDPLNPEDYIRYSKIQGTGQFIQVTLQEGEYEKEEFSKLLQEKINEKINDAKDHVVVKVINGGLSIQTNNKQGANSSIKFISPFDATKVGDFSKHNTSMDELLKNFLKETGFDCNRHIGKNGTDKMYIQTGANSGNNFMIKIGSVRSGNLGIKNLNVMDVNGVSKTLEIIDNAIQKVSSERSNLGACQNSLEKIISNLNLSSENLTASESRISDADMAKEMMELSKSNVLSQAAQAMLAQANQQPQAVLQLLR